MGLTSTAGPPATGLCLLLGVPMALGRGFSAERPIGSTREGAADASQALHPAILERWDRDAAYRPQNLAAYFARREDSRASEVPERSSGFFSRKSSIRPPTPRPAKTSAPRERSFASICGRSSAGIRSVRSSS